MAESQAVGRIAFWPLVPSHEARGIIGRSTDTMLGVQNHVLRAEVNKLTRQRDELLAALCEVVDQHGPWHDDDCPGDDTCDCSAKPLHDRINAAVRKAEAP